MTTKRFGNRLLAAAGFWSAVAAAAMGAPVADLPPDHAERMTKGLALFEKSVRSLLSQNCLKCHGGEKTKGGLDLVTREDLLRGGQDGAVVVPFHAVDSRLLRLVRHEEDPHMPDNGNKLADAQIAQLAEWIDLGAPYDKPLVEGRKPSRDASVVTAEDKAWWAFQKLSRPAVPQGRGAHRVDAFLLEKAAPKNLTFAPRAEKRVLVRRAHLDLLGVPPTPEDIAAFEKDTAPDAWEKLVARLLDSPQYGERWARHWLDVARFAESSGFEHDYDRPGAFHYRDFVIKALNQDMPFDQFIRWQLAGDEFEPDNALAISATGFLGAGVFPTQITANEVERTRYDAMDDMLSTTGSAFLGLTVGCARCHDHKYDPIPAKDYYRMLATFTTTTRSVASLDMNPEKASAALAKWQAARQQFQDEVQQCEQSLEPQFAAWLAGPESAGSAPEWTVLEPVELKSKAGATFKPLGDGSHLAEGANGDDDEYTFVARTALRRVTGLKLEALAHPSMVHGGPGRAGNGNIGLSAIAVEAGPAGGASRPVKLAKATADFEQNNGSLSIASALDDNPKSGWAVDPQFGKDHAAVFTFAEPVAATGELTFRVKLDFRLNTKHNIGRLRVSLTSQPAPSLGGNALPAAVAALLAKAKEPGFAAGLRKEDRAVLFNWWKGRDAGLQQRLAKLAAHDKAKPENKTQVFVCVEGYPPHRMHTQGADFFNETYFLKRGNAELKDGVAPQGFLQVLMPGSDAAALWQWKAPPGAKYSGRRRSLANWLTDVDQGAGALVARVAVNRLWQHHFGRGIVSTPNDFGKTGALPSQPELLDWLAGELLRHGWKLKPLHRLLMTSAAYQQSAAADAATLAADPDNSLFLRIPPRRLEGEAIRDSILSVCGALDPTMFGPGTKDEKSRRRSIYFTVKRSELIGSMVAFDQPEPLVSQGSRPITTVTPQALLLMNSPQVREWSALFARRLAKETTDPAAAAARAYSLALGRQPTAAESATATAFLAQQTQSYTAEGKPDAATLALADFCQVVLGLNEFVYLN